MIGVVMFAVAVGFVAAEEPPKSSAELEVEAQQAKINEMADATLEQLWASSDKAENLFKDAYGYAVFDNLKLAFGISGGGGSGVAVNRITGEKTYMKMGTAGIGFGLGANKYQVVFLFQDETTFRNFVGNGWSADAGAQAVAGSEGAQGQTGFVNGIAIYQFTDKGLMLQADIAGTKYWKHDKLNK